MFCVGEVVIYSAHGLCQVQEICEKTYGGKSRMYYVLHPIDDPQLTISIPTDSAAATVLPLIDKEDAESMIHSFDQPGIPWIENGNQRSLKYQGTINQGNRQHICQVVNTLMKRKYDAEKDGKKLGKTDLKLLETVQKILFTEFALVLRTTVEDIQTRVDNRIQLQESFVV